MKNSKRFFSLMVIASMLLWEINPVLPALARQPEEVKQDVASKQAPVTTDWSAVDWDGSVVLLTDLQKYRDELGRLVDENKTTDAANLQPKKVVMSSEEAMRYFAVPENIKEVVRGYRDGTGVFAKKKDMELLKSLVKNLMPEGFQFKSLEKGKDQDFIDVSKAERINIKKLIPVGQENNELTAKIKSVKDNVADHALRNVTIEGLNKKTKEKHSLGQKFLSYLTGLFKVHEVYADDIVPLIEYYDGIENNILDNALYYISKSQSDDGSFGQVANYEETAETALMLSDIKRTDNTQFSDTINYLTNTEPQNNREKAINARLMVGLGKPYLNYLDELVSVKNADHGYGLDVGMESDMLTTMEAALAMYAADYSLQEELPLALFHILNRIPADGALKYTSDGPVSYYLINKIVQGLRPFKSMTVSNDGQVNIAVQDKINVLLGYLSSQFDGDSGKILGTNDIIDQIITLKTWKDYGVEIEKQAVLEETIKGEQYINGGFGNSVMATTYALEVLKQPDLALTDLQSVGVLESKQPVSFDLTIKNRGYAKADDGIIHIFPDNFNGGLALNLKSNNIVIQPNQSIVINVTISNTDSYTGVMDMKFYAEVVGDYDHENNWIYKNFTFASAADGTPALPMYFIAQKYENGGVAGLNVRWQKKTDPNRLNYVILWREKGVVQWNYQGISNTWNGAFLTGGFVEGKTYEVTAGVLHQDGASITHFLNFDDVIVSGSSDKYLGGATGYATDNNEKLSNVYTWGYSVNKNTDEAGNFVYSKIQNGSTAAWVDVDYYDSIATKFLVPVNATTTAVRLFSRLTPDNQAPVLSGFQLRWATNYIVKSQTEYSLLAWGSDNLALKEADYYLWDPGEEIWIYLGTQKVTNGSQALMPWYVPADLLGTGYKVKAIFTDYQGNKSNEVEWGPFEVINGAPPTVKVLSPNGGEGWQLGSTQNVTWEANSPYGVSKISLYSDYDGQVDAINSNLQNTGGYQWSIPLNSNYAGTKIKLKVKAQDAQNSYTAEDSSDEYFSIVDSSPDPEKPWSRPKLISDFDFHTADNCSLSNPILDYDETGILHIFYYCISDVYGNPRIMTEQIYHVTKNNDILSAPAVVYEKVSEIYNDDYSNYRPIDANSLMLKMASNNIYIFWQDAGWGGCETFNQDELYYIYFDGQKWSEAKNLSNNNTAMRDLDVAVGGNGSLHAVWVDGKTYDGDCNSSGDYMLNYLKKDGDAWSTVEQIVLGENIYYPQISVTDDSKLHLAYQTDNYILRHAYKTAVWSTPTTIFVSSGGGMNSRELENGVDGQLHYSFNHYYNDPMNGNGYRIMYVNYNGNQWLPAEEVYPVEKNKSPEYPKLTVSENNKPHLLVEYYDSKNNIRHPLWKTKNFSGNWTNPVAIDLVSQYVDNSSNELVYHNGELSAVWIAAYSKKWNVFLNHADLAKFNTPPVAKNVIINKLPVSNNLEAGYSLSDVDGQNVTPIIDWRLNDYSLAILNMPFEANTNTAKVKDYSVLKNDAVVNGATYNASAGYNGGGTYYFDGSDYIALNDKDLNYDKLSIGLWIKTDTQKQQGIMSDYGNSSYYSSRLYMEADGRVSFQIGSHIDKWRHTVSSAKIINDNNWHYIVATYDREKIKIYIDGVLDGQDVEIKKIGIGLSWKPFIGTNTYSASTVLTAWVANAFTGFIDDVALYDSALTPEQIGIMYNGGVGNKNIIDASEFYLKGPWSVCITPNDGKEDGETVCSEKIFAGNQAPTQDNPALQQQPEKSLLLTLSNLNDADGDQVSSAINWKVNDSSILALNMPFEGGINNNIIKDYSGYGNIGSVYGAVWNKNGGHDGFGAYEFDGVDDYAKFSNNLDSLISTSSVSVSFWIKTTDKSGIVFGNSTGNYTSGFKYQLFSGWGGTSVVWFKDGSPNCNGYYSYSTKDVTDGLWHHVVAVLNREEGTIRMYVDGQHVSKPVRPVPNMGSMVSNSDLKIGVNSPGDFKGSIDDLQVFNRALSFEQIKALNSGKKFEIVNEETEFGETWQACVTPNDGKVDGQTKCSNNVALVQSNQVPTQGVPLVEKTPENNLLVVPQSVSDANGDNVSTVIDWHLNNQSLAMLNMPFDGGKLAQNNTLVKDYSLNGNNGVVTGATYDPTGGHNNTGAYYFSGASQEYIKIPGLHATDNKYTVSMWIKPVAHVNRELFFNFGGGTGLQYADLKPDNSVLFIHGANSPFTRITTKNKLVNGQWNHLVITWDGVKMYAYVNGQLDGAIQSGNVPVAMTNDTYIGSFFGSLTFTGFIDDVLIYGRSVSPEQASALFTSGLNTIVSQEITAGEGWQACVTPNDGKVDGVEKCSEIKIIS